MLRQAPRDYLDMNEAELVRRARSGDQEAFRAIMQLCNQRLFRVARAIVGSDDEAEDVVQESYLRAFAALAGFRGDSSLLTWLTAVTLNEARGRLRKRRVQIEIDAVDDMNAHIIPFPGQPEMSNPEREAARVEAGRLLEKAVDRLPPEYRLVFLLREVEGCDVEETARQLGLNPQTVRTRLLRAKRHLRLDLERKIADGMAGVFPFLGRRCAGLTDRVLERLKTLGTACP
jgi:RNA polymerase sigma-70 factor (ECF subfamily)